MVLLLTHHIPMHGQFKWFPFGLFHHNTTNSNVQWTNVGSLPIVKYIYIPVMSSGTDRKQAQDGFRDPLDSLWDRLELKLYCSLALHKVLLWLEGHSDILGPAGINASVSAQYFQKIVMVSFPKFRYHRKNLGPLQKYWGKYYKYKLGIFSWGASLKGTIHWKYSGSVNCLKPEN